MALQKVQNISIFDKPILRIAASLKMEKLLQNFLQDFRNDCISVYEIPVYIALNAVIADTVACFRDFK